jgi:hypothetical protein
MQMHKMLAKKFVYSNINVALEWEKHYFQKGKRVKKSFFFIQT